jgi:hypothetical protein
MSEVLSSLGDDRYSYMLENVITSLGDTGFEGFSKVFYSLWCGPAHRFEALVCSKARETSLPGLAAQPLLRRLDGEV